LIKNRPLLLVLFVLAALKLALIPLIDVTDADAYSRIELAHDWIQNPQWISNSVWAPLHFYLIGGALWISNHFYYTPIFLHIILSLIGTWAVYKWLRCWTSNKTAIIFAIAFALSPLLFRNSFLALSLTPFLVFVALALFHISRALNSRSIIPALYAGIFMTLACGFRYEGWLIAVLIPAIFIWKKQYASFFGYGLTAALFPAVWMISCYLSTGDAFYGINGNNEWITQHTNLQTSDLRTEDVLKRIWFFPFSLVITTGPAFMVYLFLKRKSIGPLSDFSKLAIVLTTIVLCIFITNSIFGSLMHHHRFSGIFLLLLILPIAELCNKVIQTKTAILLIVVNFFLGFIYNTKGISPIPIVSGACDDHNSAIYDNLNASSFLIIDFLGWEETYSMAAKCREKTNSIYLVSGSTQSHLKENMLLQTIKGKESGYLCLDPTNMRLDTAKIESIMKSKGFRRLISIDEDEFMSIHYY